MAIKQGWDFEASSGFTGSAGQTIVRGYARGGVVKKAKGGPVQGERGKLGPDLNVKFPGNHLAYKAGGKVQGDARGGSVKLAKGGMPRPPGMPRAPVVGMKRTRHAPGMKSMPGVPGLPAGGAGPMGVPGKPGSPPRVLAKGGKAKC